MAIILLNDRLICSAQELLRIQAAVFSLATILSLVYATYYDSCRSYSYLFILLTMYHRICFLGRAYKLYYAFSLWYFYIHQDTVGGKGRSVLTKLTRSGTDARVPKKVFL